MSANGSSGMLILNPDVEIVSVREFPMDIRQRLGGDASDFILSDRTSRISSQRIESEVAMFLRRFREPRRIVDAVFEHSIELDRDSKQMLNDIYPLLQTLRLGAILLDPQAVRTARLGASLPIGEWFEGYRILECASDLAETDVYKAESADGVPAAIKYLRSGSDETVRENLRREVEILRYASERGCRFTPRLYAANPDRDDAYVCMEWFDSRTLFSLTGSWASGLRERAGMVASMIEAYAGLHQAGVLHGDVHPRNVLILTDGSARLVDFGGARLMEREHTHPRIGLVHSYEPEVARAVLAKQEPPIPTAQGEQYCVASLAYAAITGGNYLALSLETETALNQIVSQAPRRFEELGVAWPAVEEVLWRALGKHPVDRFDSFAAFCEALVAALATDVPLQPAAAPKPASAPVATTDRRDALNQSVRGVMERHGVAADLTRTGLPRGPTSSLYAGSGGIAYALLRLGCLRQDAETLAAADVWISQALSERNAAFAFTDGSVGAATETGPLALFHSVTGLHAVNALIRYASGDMPETRQAIKAFIASVPTDAPDATADVLHLFPQDATNGAASLLIGAALLLPLCETGDSEIRARLENLAAHLRGIVQRQLDPPTRSENRFLGFAHGRTGAVYSLLRWAEVSGAPPEAPLAQCLDELAAQARHHGSGMAWPIEIPNPASPSWTGWCHGSAGHLLSWTSAARVFQKSNYLELALAAGRDIWDSSENSSPSLCCGGAGEALSLFELARACGDETWIDRGIALAAQSVNRTDYTHDAQGLFRSDVGIALAAAEALEPANSSWPVCQSPL